MFLKSYELRVCMRPELRRLGKAVLRCLPNSRSGSQIGTRRNPSPWVKLTLQALLALVLSLLRSDFRTGISIGDVLTLKDPIIDLDRFHFYRQISSDILIPLQIR